MSCGTAQPALRSHQERVGASGRPSKPAHAAEEKSIGAEIREIVERLELMQAQIQAIEEIVIGISRELQNWIIRQPPEPE
jgi:hypothetical protein